MTADSADAARDSVRELFVAHADDIHAYAARRVGRDLAKEVTAETFRQAIESWGRFDSDRGSPRAWLFGIATNLLRHHWRTERRRLDALSRVASREETSVATRAGDDPDGIVARLDARTEATEVLAAIAQLSETDRELLTLVAWEEMAHRDVAAVLDIPVGTVRSRLHRIRRELDAARRSPKPLPPTTEATGETR